MAIDYSDFALPKSRPVSLDREDRKASIASKDKAENAKAKARAKGQCEVMTVIDARSRKTIAVRCDRQDRETHHLLGGNGRRNRGKSILAEYKLRVCPTCHAEITRNILKPMTATHDAITVRFWRAR